MMGKIGAAILGAIIGGFAAVAAIVFWFGWGLPSRGQASHVDPTRADYVDLLLTLATIFLAAVGLAVTVGALVIGLVALKTLREIKDEAASAAKDAAAGKINETIAQVLEPNVNAKVHEALPAALQSALLNDELGHRILGEMAQRGELDQVLERVAMRIQGGGPESDPDNSDQFIDDEDIQT
jgi:hypothetical protein